MKEPNVFKQPIRVDKEIQAGVIAHVRSTTPQDSDEPTEVVEGRFSTSGALRTVALTDNDEEFCADVMDEESDRVWHIAVWPNPPDSDLDVSHCLVVGSKAQAREILRSLTGAPPFVPKAQRSIGAPQQSGHVGHGGQKPGRTQQKQG